MNRVAAAAHSLHAAMFTHDEPWHWESLARRKEATRASAAARKARHQLEKLRGTEKEARLEPFRGELQLLEACLNAVAKAAAGNPQMRAYVRSWQREVPPHFLMERFRRIEEGLNHWTTAAKPTRRDFLSIMAKAAAGVAAATLSPAGIKEAFAETPEQDWWQPGKLYLQLGVFKSIANATKLKQRYQGLNLRYYPQLHQTEQGKEYWYHVIVDEPHDNIPKAMAFLYAQAINVQEAGIIGFYEDGQTLWVKTPEEQIIEETEKHAEEISTLVKEPKQTDKYPYHDLVVAAVRRYPLVNVGWDASLVHGLIQIESKYDPGAGSGAGAKGLMQIMPAMFNKFHFWSLVYHPENKDRKAHLCTHRGKKTAAETHTCHLIFDAKQNIDAGVHQLYYLFQKFYKKKGDGRMDYETVKLILRYYNGGETAVRTGKLDNDEENLTYPEKVLNAQANYR